MITPLPQVRGWHDVDVGLHDVDLSWQGEVTIVVHAARFGDQVVEEAEGHGALQLLVLG